MDYIKRMRDLREDNDKTQQEIAELLHTSQTMYARYERGANELPIHHLTALADYYNVSTDYLLDVTSSQTPDHREDDLLRIFRSLSSEQKDICIEQCKAFIKFNKNK